MILSVLFAIGCIFFQMVIFHFYSFLISQMIYKALNNKYLYIF